MRATLSEPAPRRFRSPTLAHRFLTLALPAAFGIAARADAAAFPYPVAERTLDNGLRVYVVPMSGSKGVAAVATWMSVGSRDEVDPGRTGFAHFFEHLMFHGTPTVSADARERELLRLGAEDNAWTWFDETVYHALLPTAGLERFFTIEGDRFQHLTLTPDGVAREAGAVYGEFRKGQADPYEVASARLGATAFTVHPYAHDTIGFEADIAAMPTGYDYAMAFFGAHYRPENAAVIVVGDVEPEPVFALVTAAYGGWTRATSPPAPIPAEPPQTAIRRAEIAWPTSASPLLMMGWRIAAFDADDPSAAALELAADLLLSSTGPLERRLVREEGLAYSVDGGADRAVDPGLFRVTVEAKQAADLPKIEAIVREELGRLAAGVAPAELDALRGHLRQQFRSSLDDPMTVLHVLGTSLRRDPDPAALDRYRDALDASSPEAVAAAAAQLVDARLSVVTLTPPVEVAE